MARPHAVVIGAGIGGLAAAAGLGAAGWDVTVCERAAAVGAGRGGAGGGPERPARPRRAGYRRLCPGARMLVDRFGDPVILLPRTQVIDALLTRVPAQALALSTEVTSVLPGGPGAARVTTSAGDLDAALFPGHPGLRYAGFTTWRLLAGPVPGPVPMGETWGRGTVFGVMPLSDGRVYCYAAAPAPAANWPSWSGSSADGTADPRPARGQHADGRAPP